MKRTIGISAMSLLFALVVTVPSLAQAPVQGQDRGAEARANAQERVEQIRQDVQERRAQVMQDVCERRQDRLQENIPNLARGATALQNAMDSIYERVQGFYEDGQLTVSNYDELNDNVAAAQADAAASVEAVLEFEFELDCEDPNLGEQMDGFRQAVSEAREELKEYRGELVELIRALRAEAAEENAQDSEDEDDEGDNDDEQ